MLRSAAGGTALHCAAKEGPACSTVGMWDGLGRDVASVFRLRLVPSFL